MYTLLTLNNVGTVKERQCEQGPSSSPLCGACVVRSGTLGEADVRDELPAVVEGHHVLQRVGVHHQEAAVVQPHRQGLAVGREGTAAPP